MHVNRPVRRQVLHADQAVAVEIHPVHAKADVSVLAVLVAAVLERVKVKARRTAIGRDRGRHCEKRSHRQESSNPSFHTCLCCEADQRRPMTPEEQRPSRSHVDMGLGAA